MRPSFNPPATDAQIDHAEQLLGLTMPPYLRRFYLKNDGYTALGASEAFIFACTSTDNYIEQSCNEHNDYEGTYLTHILPKQREIGSSLVSITREFAEWLSIDESLGDAYDTPKAKALCDMGFPRQFFCIGTTINTLHSYWVRAESDDQTVYIMPNPRFHDADDHHEAFIKKGLPFAKLARGKTYK